MTRCPRCQRRFSPSRECAIHGRPTAVADIAEVAPAPDVVAPPGWRLGRYLATGGTAHVCSVERDGQPPAILKLGRWRERDIHGRFAAEAEVLRAVGPPTTPAYIEDGTIERRPYLIMEHVPGDTLAAWMSQHGARGGLGEIVALLTRIANALGVLHDAGFVHRDLKPENIVLDPKGARLLDFGLAKPLRSKAPELTQIGVVVGTVHYLAPEQLRVGGVVDHRADLYSFGVIAYEMMAGQPPFVGERRAIEYQHQVVRPPSLRELRDVPAVLDELVMACLAKQVEARPQSASEIHPVLSRSLGSSGTIRGVGGRVSSGSIKPLGQQSQIALVWIQGADPVAVARAVAQVRGTIVRQRGDGILAAFAATQHDAPLAVALDACRAIVSSRCRAVIHLTTALVRRTAEGKLMAYGPEVERVEGWIPTVPFTGLVLTADAAGAASGAVPAGDASGFHRIQQRDRTDVNDAHETPSLVGRSPLVAELAAAASARRVVIGVSGGAGAGKTRVLDAVVEKLSNAGRVVVHWRARRRFLGEPPDDDRLLEALGAGHPEQAFMRAAERGTILAIDDVDRLSSRLRAMLCRRDVPIARIVTSADPLFEVAADDRHRVAVQLPALSYAEAFALLRELLRPARLIPDVLVERLAIRGAGNPGLLVALARDLKARGAVRRHAGANEWYVAADELDTLLAPPDVSWLAVRALEDLPPELATVARICSALGPRFCAEEVTAATTLRDAQACLAGLVGARLFREHGGWYEFADAHLQQAVYEHTLDEREPVHAHAYRYWVARRNIHAVGRLARVAYHGARSGEHGAATACWIALAREASRRSENDQVELLLRNALGGTLAGVPAAIREAILQLDE